MSSKEGMKPRKKPVQTRSRETVDAILEAAAQVLASSGYSRTTTNHIARRAGVSIGSLYQYFPNKEAIIVSLMDDHARESRECFEALMRDSEKSGQITPRTVERFVSAMVDLHRQEPGVHQAIVKEIPIDDRDWMEGYRVLENNMAERMTGLFENTPSVRPHKGKQAALMTIRLMESLTHRQVFDDGETLSEEEFKEEITDLICRYLFKDYPGPVE